LHGGEKYIKVIKRSLQNRSSFLGLTKFPKCFSHSIKSSLCMNPESETRSWVLPEASLYRSIFNLLRGKMMAGGKRIPAGDVQQTTVAVCPLAVNIYLQNPSFL
jgi:hypothetical protein